MKYAALILILATLFSCKGEVETEEESILTLSDFDNHLAGNTKHLNKWKEEIATIPDLISEDMELDQSINYNFSPVMGTHSGNATTNEEFNSIFLSTYSLSKPLNEGMEKDFFKSDIYDIISSFINEEDNYYGTAIPSKDDDRFPSAGIAYIDAINLARYVFLIDVSAFNRGQAFAASENLITGDLLFKMYVYDMQEHKLLFVSEQSMEGPTSVSYSVDQNKSFEEQQKSADYYLDKENEEFYPKAIIDLFCEKNNFH